jgi:hypothetical protein
LDRQIRWLLRAATQPRSGQLSLLFMIFKRPLISGAFLAVDEFIGQHSL